MRLKRPDDQRVRGAARGERAALCRALLALETVDEVAAFLEDLCTPAELRALEGRLRVARLVDHGVPYRTIYEATGVSTVTVTRVARALTLGRGGYRRVLDRTGRREKR